MALHKQIRRLAWFNFFLDLRSYSPIVILYFAGVSGSFARGMSVFSVTMLVQALCEVPTGVLSDRIGRKRTLVLGAAVNVWSVVGCAIGETYGILYAHRLVSIRVG